MRSTLRALAFCALAIGIGGAGAPAQTTSTLTDEMASFQYLIGTWDCAYTLIIPGGTRQENGTATFGYAPPNSLAVRIALRDVDQAAYIHFEPRTNKYAMSVTDSLGDIVLETADRSTPGHLVFIASGGSPPSELLRNTNDKISATQFHALSETKSGDTWTKTSEATCTKRP